MEEFWTSITEHIPRLLLALFILLLGWFLARLLRKAVFVVLARTSLEEWASKRLGVKTGGKYGHRVERIVAQAVFYALLLVVAVLVLSILQLEPVNEPLVNLLDRVLLALPNVLLAIIILLFAFVLAKVVSFSLTKALQAAHLDERLSKLGGLVTREGRLSQTIGALAFWFIMVVGIVQSLAALEMQSLVQPLESALEEFASVLPNLVGAFLILVIGILVARFAGRLSTSLLTEVGFDGFISRIGLVRARAEAPESDESVEAAAEPPSEDLEPEDTDGAEKPDDETEAEAEAEAPDSQPDEEPEKKEIPAVDAVAAEAALVGLRAERTSSEVVGKIVAIVLSLLVISQVLSILQLYRLAGLVDVVIDFLPDLAVALIIIGAGTWAGNWVKGRIDDLYGGNEAGLQRFVGSTTRVGILFFATAIALQQIGVAPDLIVTAFAILFGAICLALALAFGLGGREVAGQIVRQEYDKYGQPVPKQTTGKKKARAKAKPKAKAKAKPKA